MSILLRDTRTGIITSTDLFGDTLGLYLRENPDIVRVGLGTTANSDYYVLLNSNDIESTQPNVSNNLKFNPYTGSLSGISSISGTIGYASNAGISTYATTAGIATYASNAGYASSITVGLDNSNETRYISFVKSTSGINTISVDTDLTYNPSTGVINSLKFVKTGATATNFLKANGDDSVLLSSEVANALGYVPANSASVVAYNGTTKTAGQFDGGTTAPSNTTRLNYDGYLYATKIYGDGSSLSGIDATRIINGNSNVTVNGDNTITTTANSATINTVSSTGVAMSSGKRLDISSFTETVQTLGSSGSAISGSNALDIGTYSTFIAYVGTSAVTFTLTGGVNGRLSSWTLILIYTNSGTRSITFSFGTLRYPGGSSSITLSNAQVHDVLSFFTADNATNTYASIIGLGFAT